MKVHKVTLVFVDFDQVGPVDTKIILENTKYPNRCISPKVIDVQTVDIGEWDDEHPLNHRDPENKAWKNLFPDIPN